MLNIKFIFKFNRRFSWLIVLNLILFSWINSAIAEPTQDKLRAVDSDFGLPTHRRDGGSRGSRDNCVASAENQNLIALVPEEIVSVNVSASPKVFFYVPEITDRQTLEFVLRNERDELVYEAFLSTKGEGIVGIEIPAELHSNLLETEPNYHWYLSMICDDRQRSRDIVVEGWMRQAKIDSAIQEQLNTASSIELAELYCDRGFWYDALSALAPQSAAEEPMARQKWTEMLETIGLKTLAAKPFVETELLGESISQ